MSFLTSGRSGAMSRAEGVWGEAQIANYLRRRRYELLA